MPISVRGPGSRRGVSTGYGGGGTMATMICRLPTALAPRSLLHHIAQIKHLNFPPRAKDDDLNLDRSDDWSSRKLLGRKPWKTTKPESISRI